MDADTRWDEGTLAAEARAGGHYYRLFPDVADGSLRNEARTFARRWRSYRVDATLPEAAFDWPIYRAAMRAGLGSTDDSHICIHGQWVNDDDVPTERNEHGDRWCSRCGERILVEPKEVKA